jgi:hypothetical protein
MVRGYLFIKLKEEYRQGLPFVQMLKTADTALRAAYGVQDISVARAADDRTREDYDLCITLVFVSGVDRERSLRDPVTTAFMDNFLKTRAEKVWAATFADGA